MGQAEGRELWRSWNDNLKGIHFVAWTVGKTLRRLDELDVGQPVGANHRREGDTTRRTGPIPPSSMHPHGGPTEEVREDHGEEDVHTHRGTPFTQIGTTPTPESRRVFLPALRWHWTAGRPEGLKMEHIRLI